MKAYFTQRLRHLREELRSIEATEAPILQKCESALDILIVYDREFREKLKNDDFSSPEEEIYYFRHQRPVFTSAVIYNVKLYHIEVRRPVGSAARLRRFYSEELSKIGRFFEANEGFIRYLRSGSTELDAFFFMRNKVNCKMVPQTSYFILDHTLTTDFDWKLGKLKAFERLVEYLRTAIAGAAAEMKKADREKDMRQDAGNPQPAIDFNDLLKTHQVLKRLKISRSKLQRLKDSGQLPYIKSENVIYYRESDIIAYLARNRHNEFDN